jgi:hypothetical protein
LIVKEILWDCFVADEGKQQSLVGKGKILASFPEIFR